jgi:hypothetical protein
MDHFTSNALDYKQSPKAKQGDLEISYYYETLCDRKFKENQ